MSNPMSHLFEINKRVLEQEADVRRARLLLRLGYLGLILGPATLVAIYVLAITVGRQRDIGPYTGLPGFLAVGITALSAWSIYWHVFKADTSLRQLDLELQALQEERRLKAGTVRLDQRARRSAYRVEVGSDLLAFRKNSRYYRRVHNALQSVVIIGSIASSALSGLSIELQQFRWATVLLTFVVGIAAGFIGYFKFRERSFYLQQTADAIEHEASSADLGIYRYADISNDDDRVLQRFVEEVERLKVEQRKREQNLDQPHERTDDQAG